jgi:fluoride exporter
MNYLIVFAGAGIGGALRHGVNIAVAKIWGIDFPFGTLSINVFGSLAMGLVVGYFAYIGAAPQQLRLFLTTGMVGGFTTFSAFSLETVMLYERGQWAAAAAYVISSTALSVGALFAGLVLVRSLVS